MGGPSPRDVHAVLISDDPEEAAAIRTRWERQLPDVPLVIVESPYRALVAPLISYLDVLDRGWPQDKEAPITFVVVPEYVARNWWERILYNQSAKRLRAALLGRPHTVVVNVPYRREQEPTEHGADGPRRQTRPLTVARSGTDPACPARTGPAQAGRARGWRHRPRRRCSSLAALVRIAGLFGPGPLRRPHRVRDLGGGRRRDSGSAATTRTAATPTTRRCCTCCGRSGSPSTGPSCAFAIRTLSIPFDLGLGALLFWVVRSQTGRGAATAFARGRASTCSTRR